MGGPTSVESKSGHPGAATGSGIASKSKENKDFISNPLFVKDLAGESRQSLDSKRPAMGGGTTSKHRPAEKARKAILTKQRQKIYFRAREKTEKQPQSQRPALFDFFFHHAEVHGKAGHRQLHGESRALTHFGFYRQFPAVTAQNPLADR